MNVIKEQMKYFNYSIKDLSTITGITERTIRNIISGRNNPDVFTLRKLEDAFELERGDLYSFFENKKNRLKINHPDEMIKIVDEALGKVYAFESIKQKITKVFKGKNCKNYSSYLKSNSINYYQFKDNDLAKLWIALMERKSIREVSQGTVLKKDRNIVIKGFLKIIFSDNSFDERISKLKTFLSERGIILINGPYFAGSAIRGATITRNKNRYIYMNDSNKRECIYIFTLLHELMHIYDELPEQEINNNAAKAIMNFLETNNIDHEIKTAIENYDKYDKEKYFNIIHDLMKLKVNFGSVNNFIKENI